MNELDFGFEWSLWKYAELVIQYTRTLKHSNTRTFPYRSTTNADRLGIQLQMNY